MQYLVTGAAGFIGFHVARRLLSEGETVLGVDNLNDYYDVALKEDRLGRLRGEAGFEFEKLDIADRAAMEDLFEGTSVDGVVHLAAQAGVRHSLEEPHTYVRSNLVGFLNVLEGCRHHDVPHLVFASSSSVYGANEKQPYSVQDTVDHPVSLYAATKKSDELMAHAYANLYDLPVTGLRYFTVYGPWGRPDMAAYIFADRILRGEPIDVFNHGDMQRDFTYVDDVVEGTLRVLERPPDGDPDWDGSDPDPATSHAPYRIFNIGRGDPVHLMDFIEALEEALGREAEKNFRPMQPGDIPSTHADVTGLEEAVGYRPRVSVEEGTRRFAEWFREYHGG